MIRHWTFLAAAVAAASTLAAEDGLTPLGKVTTEWVRTRDEAVRAETEWNSQKELLASTAAQFADRARALEDRRDALKARSAKDQTAIEELRRENDLSHKRLAEIESALLEVDRVLVRLRPEMPPRLSAALELPYRSLASAHLPPGERMQLTIAVFNRCEQFNRAISFGQEVVAADGLDKPKLLDCVYWGMADGYAYDAGTGMAWLGYPTEGAWHWHQAPSIAGALRGLLAAHRDEREPELVSLPAQVSHVDGSNR